MSMFQRILIANRGEIACRLTSAGRPRLRVLTVVLAIGFSLVASTAEACGTLNRLGLRREAARQARELEGTRIVEGRWQLETVGEGDDRSGWVIERFRNRDTGRRFHASGSDEINCGFPAFPQDDGATGTFYLRRHGSWRIVHFAPDEATLERDVSRPPPPSPEQ